MHKLNQEGLRSISYKLSVKNYTFLGEVVVPYVSKVIRFCSNVITLAFLEN